MEFLTSTFLGVPIWAILVVDGLLWANAARLAAIRIGNEPDAAVAAVGGFLLGPFGFLYALLGVPARKQRCMACWSWVPLEAKACRFCTRDLVRNSP